MATTPYDLKFRVDRKDEPVCTKTLSSDDVAKFRRVSSGMLVSVVLGFCLLHVILGHVHREGSGLYWSICTGSFTY